MYWIIDCRSKPGGGEEEKHLLNVMKQMSKAAEPMFRQAAQCAQAASRPQGPVRECNEIGSSLFWKSNDHTWVTMT